MQTLPLLLIVTLGTLHHANAEFINKDKLDNANYRIFQEPLKELDYHCTKVTIAETEVAKSQLIQKLESSNSYVLVYKKDQQWLLEKDLEKSLKIIKDNLSKKISYGQGNISVGGVAFPGVKYVVAIN